MFNLNFKRIFFLLFCLCIFLGISCACAADMNIENKLNSTQDTGDLNNEITKLNPGDEYNFEKNYTVSGDNTIDIKTSNVTINGNGYSINAHDHTGSVFNVFGDNVVIKNLNIIGANEAAYNHDNNIISASNDPYYMNFTSPICWYGNNGKIDACIFSNNYGVNGGVISFYGDNESIENTLFINSTALGVGAAFYNGGINNTFTNTTFINSKTCLINEDFFTDKRIIADNNTNNSYIGIGNSDFDVDNFKYFYPVNFIDAKVNIIPIIYGSLTGFYPIDGDIPNAISMGAFVNNTFTLSIDHYIDDVTFSLSYLLTNLTNANDIITKFKQHNYTNTLKLSKNIVVYDIKSYTSAHSITTVNSFSKDIIKACFDIVDKDNADAAYKISSTNVGKSACLSTLKEHGVSFSYNVLFNGTYHFDSHDTWDISALGFDIVSIRGNGSTIDGLAGSRDEYKFAIVQDNILSIEGLNIKGFNNAIVNYGLCTLNDVVFNENRMDYKLDRDWGAAILNAGYCICNNCSFNNNYASNGGAIFTQGQLILNNCTFLQNTGYKLGNDVLNADKGIVLVNGSEISLEDEEISGVVTYTESGSLDAITIGSFISSILTAGATGYLFGSAFGPFGIIIGAAIGVGVSLVGSQIAARNLIYDMNFNLGEYTVELAIECAILGMTAFGLGQMIKYSMEHPINKKVEKSSDIVEMQESSNDDINQHIYQQQDPYNQDQYEMDQSSIESADEKPSDYHEIRDIDGNGIDGWEKFSTKDIDELWDAAKEYYTNYRDNSPLDETMIFQAESRYSADYLKVTIHTSGEITIDTYDIKTIKEREWWGKYEFAKTTQPGVWDT